LSDTHANEIPNDIHRLFFQIPHQEVVPLWSGQLALGQCHPDPLLVYLMDSGQLLSVPHLTGLGNPARLVEADSVAGIERQ
jgi:hypothetical protein